MVVGFTEAGKNVNAEFGEFQFVTIDSEPYEGDYTVTPKVSEQTMPTKGKVMQDDVTVKPVPFFNVGNTSGGNTVYIASEI
jgi:hypothetical protein